MFRHIMTLKSRLLIIWDTRPEFFKKSYWVTDFPDCYDPKCFDCNLGSCEGCEYSFNIGR